MEADTLFALLSLSAILFTILGKRLIGERRRSEAARRESERRYRALLENAPMGICLSTVDGRVMECNSTLLQMFGYSKREMKQISLKEAYRAPHVRAQLLECLQKDGFVKDFECEMKRKDGRIYYASLSATLFAMDGRSVLLTMLRDITVRRTAELALLEAKRKLQILASQDGLTGIANRRLFEHRLKLEWDRSVREQTAISLVMADIDFFKAYNDTYGHLAGDECLKKVSRALQCTLKRPADMLARYGGEEFAVLLPNTRLNGALLVAMSMRAAVETLDLPHPLSKAGDRVTVSLGVASMMPQRDITRSELVRAADGALYLAKGRGRNRVETAEVFPNVLSRALPLRSRWDPAVPTEYQ